MSAQESKQDLISLLAIIVITSVIIGVHGLVSILFMITVSRFNFGRDSNLKHGVSSGASRLGGIAILFSLTSGLIINHYLSKNLSIATLSYYIDDLLIFSFLIGFVGLVEDFYQNLSSKLRLSLIVIIVGMSTFSLNEILPFELELFNPLEGSLKIILVYIFTVIMVSGFVNAGNIADGANGLLASIFLAFFIVAYSLDNSIFNFSVMISLIAFIIYNVMTGKIFLGDFGAYSLSALVAFKSLEFYANGNVSVFFLAALLVYPCFELARSLLLRLVRNTSIMSPDNNHLHNYINEYIINFDISKHISNSFTGIGIAVTTSGIPVLIYFFGSSIQSNIWQIIFAIQLLSLSLIYMFFEKKSRENTNH